MVAVNPLQITFSDWPQGAAGLVFWVNPGATPTVPTPNLPGMTAPSVKKAIWKPTQTVLKAEGNDAILRQSVRKKGWELQLDYEGKLDPAFESYITGANYSTHAISSVVDSASDFDTTNDALPTLAVEIWALNDDGNGSTHWGGFNLRLVSFPDDTQEMDKYDTVRSLKFSVLPDSTGAMRRRAFFKTPKTGDPTAQPNLVKLTG